MEVFVESDLIKKDEILTRKMLQQIEIDFEEGRLLRVIANSVWHKAVDFPKLEYLIRADGLPGSIACTQISGRLSRLHDDNVKWLVDFNDNFDRICNGRAQQRRRHYAKHGWRIENRVVTVPVNQAAPTHQGGVWNTAKAT